MDEGTQPDPPPEPERSASSAGSRWAVVAVLAAVGFIGLLTLGVVNKSGPSIAVGEEAPDASVGQLGGGGDIELADYRGKWVLLNFWASWCEPCRSEAPAIEEFSKRNSKDLVVVGMDSRDLSPDGLAFADDFDLTYVLAHDGDGDFMDSYNVKGLPESFLIDPDGNIAYIYRGPVDERILEENFQPLIEGSAT
jgi:cytochrome c biogenesis protein CcmG, thiol:disulfide interchange protein DsbE